MDVLHMFLAAPTSLEWWRFAAVLGGLAGVVAFGEVVRGVFRWSPEFTRKLVHVSVGLLVFFAPSMFVVPLPAILLAVVFIAINFMAIRLGLLKGMHDSGRRSYGTVYYPLAFLILVVLFWYRDPMILSCSILVLALGDAAAAVVGEGIKSPSFFRLSSDKKSVQGSLAMALVSFVVLVAGIVLMTNEADRRYDMVFAIAGVAAVTATASEALSSKGLDNLTIPLSVAFVLSYCLPPTERAESTRMTLGAGFAVLIALVSYRMRMLALSGAVATFLLALVVFGIGGWQWTVPILTFFLSSSLLSMMGKDRKAVVTGLQKKSGIRDYGQVFANGGVAGILVIASYVFPAENWYPLYLGSLAAVTADTWSTEIGLLGRGPTIMITTFERVERGLNGGITWQGIAGAFAGSMLIAVSGSWWIVNIKHALFVVIVGVMGSLVDSVLGATVQAEYRCPVCGALTERKVHCTHHPTVLVRGRPWITNDAVNWVCAAAGPLFMSFVG